MAIMNMIRRANKTKVDPKLMEQALEAVGELSADQRDFEGATITLVKIVSELGVPERQRMDLGLAINFRLMALARLTRDGGGRGWVFPVGPDCDLIHKEMIRCAAEEPMIEVNGEVTFDPESFHRRLLALAEMQGEA